MIALAMLLIFKNGLGAGFGWLTIAILLERFRLNRQRVASRRDPLNPGFFAALLAGCAGSFTHLSGGRVGFSHQSLAADASHRRPGGSPLPAFFAQRVMTLWEGQKKQQQIKK